MSKQEVPVAHSLLGRIKNLVGGVMGGDRAASRIRRRKKLGELFDKKAPSVCTFMMILGYLWILALPLPQLGHGTYIDENALQPAQVTTQWDWDNVHTADTYLVRMEKLTHQNLTSYEMGLWATYEFRKLGFRAQTLNYTYNALGERVTGTNVAAFMSSPRASGTEAILISASWNSVDPQGGLRRNLRGVATVMSLAVFLKKYSLWSKDFVFVISDGYLDGMNAWLSSFHGVEQPNLQVETPTITAGVIWTALNIDYPGHSFSHLGIFREGLNGRLPNQDLLNCFQRISEWTGGVPVVLYDHVPGSLSSDSLPWLPKTLTMDKEFINYAERSRNVLRHLVYQGTGSASGLHGLMHRYRIDAFTMYALPAQGPHGFHAIGRVIESTLRTMNNLLERLHASFFFYILTTPTSFLKVGDFLPSALLISVSMLFRGLHVWVNVPKDSVASKQVNKPSASAPQSIRSGGSVTLLALAVIAITHLLWGTLFLLSTQLMRVVDFRTASHVINEGTPLVFLLLGLAVRRVRIRNLGTVIHSLNLCLASTIISVCSVLNFSLSVMMGLSLCIPLSFASPIDDSKSMGFRIGVAAVVVVVAAGWQYVSDDLRRQAIWDWTMLGNWFAPFVTIVYVPLLVQSGLVCFTES